MTDQRLTKIQRAAAVAKVFTPGAPINKASLFAGRLDLAIDVLGAVAQRGQHVILYGERGVGKTSLANVLTELFPTGDDAKHLRGVRVTCNTNDTFYSVWTKLFRELELDDSRDGASARDPEDVRYVLEHYGKASLIIIDELDRLEDDESLSLFADTVKSLSDHSVAATLVFVGVADSVDELLGEHRSIERALTQVQMPRMSASELVEILERGLNELDMRMGEATKARIAQLSEGLPYFTHLLALHATQRAVSDDRDHVNQNDVTVAIDLAVQKAQHSIRSAYQKATRSPRRDSRFEEVLLACALAPKDELGYFAAGGVRGPMSKIMDKDYQIPAFARHLKEFTTIARGCVLQKEGQHRRYFYRFENPLLQPFVILNGLNRKLISDELLNELRGDTAKEEELNVGPNGFGPH